MTRNDDPNMAGAERSAASPTAPPTAAVVAAVAVLVAAAIASGSAGLLGHPLRHALTWGAVAVALIAAGPRTMSAWLAPAGAVALGLLMTAVDLPAVNVLAVALVGAALARSNRRLSGRAILLAALAAAAFGLFRFATDSIPLVWQAADVLGWLLGVSAGAIAGRPLWLGATFGGVDLLVLMAALLAGWLVSTAPPRWPRAIFATAAIGLGHLGYLVVLAFCGEMVAALPDVALPPVSTNSHLGVWAWGSAARSLLPWNLPAVAVAIQATIALAMFRLATWLPVDEDCRRRPGDETGALSARGVGRSSGNRGPQPSTTRPRPTTNRLFDLAPVGLAAVAAVLSMWALGRSNLDGKTIVAARDGFVDWNRPRHDTPSIGMYGMLGPLVESLGGQFVLSDDLSDDDLAKADVLLMIHPNQDWIRRREVAERIWKYVEGGGSLLVAAEPEMVRGDRASTFNELLAPTQIRVRRDTALSETIGWEHACQPLAHPATLGIGDRRNRFGLTAPSSLVIGPRVKPLLVGRWAWGRPGSGGLAAGALGYDPGEKLGDLVVAAEQSVGRGTVVVLGDTSCLHNDIIANSYPFVGRLLGYLAHRPVSPQAWWRQCLALLAAAGCVALLAVRPCPLCLGATVVVLAGAVFGGRVLAHHTARVVPGDGGLELALIDGAHQPATSSEIWDDFGIGGLARTLMRNDYLPLRVPDLSAERLAAADLLITIGPARPYSAREQQAIHHFVESGGTFIAMVGAERAVASSDLLDSFGFRVPYSPVAPRDPTPEPEPIGAHGSRYLALDGFSPTMQFYAAWPVECRADGADVLKNDSRGVPIIVVRSVGRGNVVVIGDTFFAANENLESATRQDPDNMMFWRWFLTRVTPREAWIPSDPNAPDPPADSEVTP